MIHVDTPLCVASTNYALLTYITQVHNEKYSKWCTRSLFTCTPMTSPNQLNCSSKSWLRRPKFIVILSKPYFQRTFELESVPEANALLASQRQVSSSDAISTMLLFRYRLLTIGRGRQRDDFLACHARCTWSSSILYCKSPFEIWLNYKLTPCR